MKTIIGILDEIAALAPWVIVAWVLFGFVSMATAQQLTKEQDIIAQTLLGEARGEGKQGVYAVGCVIKQRMNLKSFPNTAMGVCLQRSQFEYWVQNKKAKWDDQNRETVRRLMKTDIEIVRYAKQVAIHIDSLDLSYTDKADHYCHINENNYWTRGQVPVRVIEKHKFYKLRK